MIKEFKEVYDEIEKILKENEDLRRTVGETLKGIFNEEIFSVLGEDYSFHYIPPVVLYKINSLLNNNEILLNLFNRIMNYMEARLIDHIELTASTDGDSRDDGTTDEMEISSYMLWSAITLRILVLAYVKVAEKNYIENRRLLSFSRRQKRALSISYYKFLFIGQNQIAKINIHDIKKRGYFLSHYFIELRRLDNISRFVYEYEKLSKNISKHGKKCLGELYDDVVNLYKRVLGLDYQAHKIISSEYSIIRDFLENRTIPFDEDNIYRDDSLEYVREYSLECRDIFNKIIGREEKEQDQEEDETMLDQSQRDIEELKELRMKDSKIYCKGIVLHKLVIFAQGEPDVRRRMEGGIRDAVEREYYICLLVRELIKNEAFEIEDVRYIADYQIFLAFDQAMKYNRTYTKFREVRGKVKDCLVNLICNEQRVREFLIECAEEIVKTWENLKDKEKENFVNCVYRLRERIRN